MELRKKSIEFNKLFLPYCLSMILMITILYSVYSSYRKTVITKQQEQLITYAEMASMYLKNFLDENLILADAYFDFRGYSDGSTDVVNDRIRSYREAKKEYIKEISFYENDVLSGTGMNEKNDLTDDEISNLKSFIDEGGNASLGPVAANGEGGFDLLILKKIIYNEKDLGLIIFRVDLKSVYSATIGKIEIGHHGYFTVKDRRGTILMHSDSGQIGINSFQERKKNYSKIDENELRELIRAQLKGEPGSSIIESYWWGTDEENKVRKIISYVPLDVGDNMWIVNAVMSYDEIAVPVRKTAKVLFLLGAAVLGGSCIFIFKFTKVLEAGKQYKMKAEYEKQLNEALKRLIKHEENLNQLNRIETIGMFSGAMVHDIRNYLVPIQIYCDILISSRPGEEDALEYLREMKKAVDNCTSLTKRILKYSGGNKDIEEDGPFDACFEVDECISLSKTILPENIKLEYINGADSVALFGNKLEFKQILLNLMTNSYHAMEGKGGKLTVEFYKENHEAVLIVSDTGCGMTEEQKKDIFVPFYTSNSGENGTGLGLPIVKRLVEEFNGTIAFKSTIGSGTSFTVRFPLKI